MKLNTKTLGLLAGAAAISGVALSADVQKNAEPGQQTKKPAAHVKPKTKVPQPITERELKSLFILCDGNKDGNIPFEEFKKAYPAVERNGIARIITDRAIHNRPPAIDPLQPIILAYGQTIDREGRKPSSTP